jgi:hypothetical protein
LRGLGDEARLASADCFDDGFGAMALRGDFFFFGRFRAPPFAVPDFRFAMLCSRPIEERES